MRVIARRCILRHECRPYGAQQARKLPNASNGEVGNLSAAVLLQLLLSVDSLTNKGWARRLPAAAVITAPQVVLTIIGPKASVAGLMCLW